MRLERNKGRSLMRWRAGLYILGEGADGGTGATGESKRGRHERQKTQEARDASRRSSATSLLSVEGGRYVSTVELGQHAVRNGSYEGQRTAIN